MGIFLVFTCGLKQFHTLNVVVREDMIRYSIFEEPNDNNVEHDQVGRDGMQCWLYNWEYCGYTTVYRQIAMKTGEFMDLWTYRQNVSFGPQCKYNVYLQLLTNMGMFCSHSFARLETGLNLFWMLSLIQAIGCLRSPGGCSDL